MKYILTEDLSKYKKGTIIDENDKFEMIIIVGRDFYKANPKQFMPLPELEESSL